MSLDVKIPVEEIDRVLRKLISDISKFRNRHKEGVCLGLTLIYKNIDEWYNEINAVYSREISAQITPGGIDKEKRGDIITEITTLTRRSRKQIPAGNSKEFLEKIVNDKDYRKVLDNLEPTITPSEIETLKQDILREDKEHGFIDLALEQK